MIDARDRDALLSEVERVIVGTELRATRLRAILSFVARSAGSLPLPLGPARLAGTAHPRPRCRGRRGGLPPLDRRQPARSLLR